MKTLIVCTSVSHGNTARVAAAMGGVLDASIVTPNEVDLVDLADADLVGFGSGVFNMDLHPQLRDFVASLPRRRGGFAFVFATSGLPEPPFRRYLGRFANTLQDRGFEVLDTFSCRGYDTWWPFKIVGGIRKTHPDETDLQSARQFAQQLRIRLSEAHQIQDPQH